MTPELAVRLRARLMAGEGPYSALLARELAGVPDTLLLASGWALLGVRPASKQASWAQVSGLSEFSDLSRPSEADRLAATLGGDPWLVTDLLTPRPWLEPRRANDLGGTLHAVLASEWRGFVAQVGVVGPWLCVSGVSGVQGLSARYTQLATAAFNTREDVLQDAVAALWAAGRPDSLLSRLASVKAAQVNAPRSPPLHDPLPLAALEGLFWAEAGAQAAARKAARGGK